MIHVGTSLIKATYNVASICFTVIVGKWGIERKGIWLVISNSLVISFNPVPKKTACRGTSFICLRMKSAASHIRKWNGIIIILGFMRFLSTFATQYGRGNRFVFPFFNEYVHGRDQNTKSS